MSRTLAKLNRKGGVSLKMLQHKRASSSVEGIICWFFSSCGRNLGVPLELRWDLRVASGKSNLHASCKGPLKFLSSQCWGLGPHLELRPEPQSSSPVWKWISGYLWSFKGVQASSLMGKWKPASSRAVKVLSGFLSG